MMHWWPFIDKDPLAFVLRVMQIAIMCFTVSRFNGIIDVNIVKQEIENELY